MQNKTKIFIIFLFLLTSSLFAKKTDNVDLLFSKNSLIPSYVSSVFVKIPAALKFQSDNFYSSPNTLLFLTIRNLSKGITKDLFKYTGKDVEARVYLLSDRIQSEIFPYSQKTETTGLALFYENSLVSLFYINDTVISSINSRNYLLFDTNDETLERFLKKYNSLKFTKRDKFLKTLDPKTLLQEMTNNFNNKQFDNFYSCFSLKYKFKTLMDNFRQKKTFNYDANETFLGNIKTIKSIKIKSITDTLISAQFSSLSVYETVFEITNLNNESREQKYFLFLNSSPSFGYRIYDIKLENPTQTQN